MAELAMLLTDSGRLNHKVVTRPASSLAQDREGSPAETSVLTITLRRQVGDLWLMLTRPMSLGGLLSPAAKKSSHGGL